ISVSSRRFYLPPDQCKERTLFLAGREAHHALHVIRVRKGDRVTVLNGTGEQFECVVEEYDRDKVLLAVQQTISAPHPPWQVSLFQAVPKGKLMDSIVQKGTELGVHRIVPVLCERVVSQFGAKERAGRKNKWQLAAIEALKQSGLPWLPQVEAPIELAQLL